MSRRTGALAACLVVGALGCTPSPTSLCDHVTSVVERQYGPTDPAHPHKSHHDGVEHCKSIWTEKQKQDPKAYECYAACATATKKMVDLAECRPKCFPHEAKPPDEPEKAQNFFWSDDAGSDGAAPGNSMDPPEAGHGYVDSVGPPEAGHGYVDSVGPPEAGHG